MNDNQKTDEQKRIEEEKIKFEENLKKTEEERIKQQAIDQQKYMKRIHEYNIEDTKNPGFLISKDKFDLIKGKGFKASNKVIVKITPRSEVSFLKFMEYILYIFLEI